ncbi:MAG: redoxin domain-containing protein [Thermodesulfovibrionia bacterium]|nr:redoxin domain-containing protein [Thermodesulfovibrionia bacterium]
MILVMLLSFFLLFSPAYAISVTLGGNAPDFTLRSVQGKTISLREYKNKVVVLIYWRTDQKRSLLALKDGQDIFRKYKDKGVQVIGLTAESENPEAITKIFTDYEIGFPALLDPDRKVYGDYGIRVYPSTVIIDKKGKLAYDIPGHAVTYKTAFEGYVRYILKEIDEAELQEIISPHKRDKKDKSLLEAVRRYNLALKFTEARLIDQAIDAVKKSIDANKDMVKSHILLGFLLLEEKEADEAIVEFRRALELEPRSHDAQTGIGGALILKGELDRAIEILDAAAIANPYPHMTYYELGRAYELKGEKDRAIEMYKKVTEKIINMKILPSSISKCR